MECTVRSIVLTKGFKSFLRGNCIKNIIINNIRSSPSIPITIGLIRNLGSRFIGASIRVYQKNFHLRTRSLNNPYGHSKTCRQKKNEYQIKSTTFPLITNDSTIRHTNYYYILMNYILIHPLQPFLRFHPLQKKKSYSAYFPFFSH